jgi:hypothetical protein
VKASAEDTVVVVHVVLVVPEALVDLPDDLEHGGVDPVCRRGALRTHPGVRGALVVARVGLRHRAGRVIRSDEVQPPPAVKAAGARVVAREHDLGEGGSELAVDRLPAARVSAACRCDEGDLRVDRRGPSRRRRGTDEDSGSQQKREEREQDARRCLAQGLPCVSFHGFPPVICRIGISDRQILPYNNYSFGSSIFHNC